MTNFWYSSKTKYLGQEWISKRLLILNILFIYFTYPLVVFENHITSLRRNTQSILSGMHALIEQCHDTIHRMFSHLARLMHAGKHTPNEDLLEMKITS